MNLSFKLLSMGAVLTLGLTACGAKDDAAHEVAEESVVEETGAVETANSEAALAAALASDMRPDEDKADDAARKPGAVIAFAGIAPGMSVFEMEAGSGYYTEIISHIVGPEGSVIMQNPESFDAFLGDAVPKRLADDRLANVRHTKSNFDNLDAEDASADVVTWILGPHEMYFTPSDGVTLGEVGPTYDEVFRVLKPGGSFVVLDHKAAPGSPETTGGTLHRIDPDIVKGLAASAGFVLVEESDVLANAEDDYSMSVFDPKVRRNTDRFLHKYAKPE
ncbi:MAG: methyltransferase [Hyphococcus sp.]|nr:MAG: methyltransferase [Marinicaulis sp.]